LLTEGEAAPGPVAAVRQLWQKLPEQPDEARAGCVRMRDAVVRMRKVLRPKVEKVKVTGISPGSQPLALWHNAQLAARHRAYCGDANADRRAVAGQEKDADVARALACAEADPVKIGASLARFCDVFPDAFVVSDRGPYFDPNGAGKGRPLTAGFHLMHGHFRDDGPLCELILDEPRRRELDALWQELDFVTLAPMRQDKDFIFSERGQPTRFACEAERHL